MELRVISSDDCEIYICYLTASAFARVPNIYVFAKQYVPKGRCRTES